VQVVLASVGEKHIDYVKDVEKQLLAAGIRVEANVSSDTIGSKVRNAAKQKVPWTIVLGDKEIDGDAFSVKVFGSTESISVKREDLVQEINKNNPLV